MPGLNPFVASDVVYEPTLSEPELINAPDLDPTRIAKISWLAQNAKSDAGIRLALMMLAPDEPDLDTPFERPNDGSAAQPSNGTAASGQVIFDPQMPADNTGNAYVGIILMRQPGRAVLANTANQQGAGYCMVWLASQLAQANWNFPQGHTTPVNPIGAISNSASVSSGMVPGTGFKPHNTYLGAGYLTTGDGGNYNWVDAQTNTSSIVVWDPENVNLPATLVFSLWAQVDDEEVMVGTSLKPSGSLPYLVIGVSASYYYRIKCANTGTADVLGLTIFTAVGPCPQAATATGAPVGTQPACTNIWMHLALPALYDDGNLYNISAIRLIGLSAKLSNYSAALFKNGSIVSATIGSGEDWQQTLTGGLSEIGEDYYNSIAALARWKDLPAYNGWYGICKPNDIEDFRFHNDICKGTNSGVNQAVLQFPLVNDSPYIAMAGSIAVSSLLAAPSLKAYVRTTYETYVTVSQNASLAKPTSTYLDLQKAIGIVNYSRQFWENPYHLSDIAELVGNWLPLVAAGSHEILTMAGYPQVGEQVQKYGNQIAATALQYSDRRKRQRAQNPNDNSFF